MMIDRFEKMRWYLPPLIMLCCVFMDYRIEACFEGSKEGMEIGFKFESDDLSTSNWIELAWIEEEQELLESWIEWMNEWE